MAKVTKMIENNMVAQSVDTIMKLGFMSIKWTEI